MFQDRLPITSVYLGMAIPTFNKESQNHPYYWVDEFIPYHKEPITQKVTISLMYIYKIYLHEWLMFLVKYGKFVGMDPMEDGFVPKKIKAFLFFCHSEYAQVKSNYTPEN